MEGFLEGSDLIKFALPGALPGLVLCPELRLAFRVCVVLSRLERESRAGCVGALQASEFSR